VPPESIPELNLQKKVKGVFYPDFELGDHLTLRDIERHIDDLLSEFNGDTTMIHFNWASRKIGLVRK